MNDVVPDLDTIEFDQLVELARGEIPRYAPDWTDHNLHDPGMTLVDLLAWVVDQQVFRAGFVGGRYRSAFAALLGQRTIGPKPARGLVWPAQPLPEGRIVQAGIPMVCLQHLDVGCTLDVDTELYLPPVAVTAVALTRDGDKLPASATGGGSWDIGSPADATVTLQLNGPLGADGPVRVALGFDVAPPPGPPPAPGDRPWGPVGYAYRIGTGAWVELTVVHDGTEGLARTGVVVLTMPPAGGATGEAELRLRFDRGFFPVAPQIRTAAVNVLPVVQQRPEAPAVLGTGTSLPDQVVAVGTADLVDPPQIRVGGQAWQARADFVRSGPDDQHYVVFDDHVLFGNGVNGHRPPIGAGIQHTGLVRTLGMAGNLRPGLTWSVPALGPQTYGQNREALAGGADRTTPDELARAARQAAVGQGSPPDRRRPGPCRDRAHRDGGWPRRGAAPVRPQAGGPHRGRHAHARRRPPPVAMVGPRAAPGPRLALAGLPRRGGGPARSPAGAGRTARRAGPDGGGRGRGGDGDHRPPARSPPTSKPPRRRRSSAGSPRRRGRWGAS